MKRIVYRLVYRLENKYKNTKSKIIDILSH